MMSCAAPTATTTAWLRMSFTAAGSFEVDRDPIEEAIFEMINAARIYTFDEFTETLGRLGARLDGPTVSDHESCGCAVFYPELIGDKRPGRIRKN